MFLLKWFPGLVSARESRKIEAGSLRDRKDPDEEIRVTFHERVWDGLAAITIRCGRQGASFTLYGETLNALQIKLGMAVLLVREGTGLPGEKVMGFGYLTYDGAHPVVRRDIVCTAEHPFNSRFRVMLTAVTHDDGEISAAVDERVPWMLGGMYFPPGLFKAIELYLEKVSAQRKARRPG